MTEWVKQNRNNGSNLTALQKAGCGLVSGALGSFIGTPFDVALVRMQSDLTLPIEERRNYNNVFNAFSRIIREEGIRTLWSGAIPTMSRAVSLNVA
jgi:solute carrier family 25 oxoglutarate transporter 11